MRVVLAAFIILFAMLILFAMPTVARAQEVSYEPIWSYETGGDVRGVSISSDGSYIVAGSGREVILLNRDRELLWNFQTAFPVTDVSISADASYIIVGTLRGGVIDDGWLYILNREGELLEDFETTGISSVSISPDGSYWAMTYQHGLGWWDKVILYCLVEGSWLWIYTVGQSGTGAVSISADGELIAVSSGAGGGDECEIRLYNKEGKLLWRYEIPGRFLGRAHSVSISADGRHIVAGDEYGDEILLLDNKGEVVWSYRTGIIEGVSISGDGSYIVAGSRDGIYLLNRDGKLLWNYKINGISSVSISADGNSIVVGANDEVSFFQKSQIAAQNAIKKAHDAVYLERSKGLVVTEAESLLSQAEQSFTAGYYSRAKSLAEQAKAKAEAISREATTAKTAIEVAESTVEAEKAKGFNVAKAGELLAQAEQSFTAGYYSRAKSLADEAKALAIDIDQDGVPNYEDFAPTINNNHIYGGAFLLVLGTISASAGVFFYRRRKKAEKEEIERKKRADEEARKRNEIKKLILETKNIIENARKDVKNPLILSALISLKGELFELSEAFKNELISYQEIKSILLEKKEEAEILSKQTEGGEIAQENYYSILGVDFNATPEEIKNAYYAKIHDYHPDKFSNTRKWVILEANKITKKINEAYQVLKDPKKRIEYDEKLKTS